MVAAVQVAPTGRMAVLLVEDDWRMRELLGLWLRPTGCRVFAASDGREALALTIPTALDCALVDLSLPDISGLEVAHKLRQSRPTLRIVFASGWEASEAGELDGDSLFLEKPFTAAELIAAVMGADSRTLSLAC
jgi:DNA-binding response OmpR family regulator